MGQKILRYFLVGLGYLTFTFFILFPLIWIFMMSIKEFRDIIAYPPVFTFKPTLTNYFRSYLAIDQRGADHRISGLFAILRNSAIIQSTQCCFRH